MQTVRLPIATNSYPAASKPLSVQKLVNLYAETQPQDAKAKVALFQRPGMVLWSNLGSPVRAMFNVQGTLYAVAGTGVYRIASNGVSTLLGNVSVSTGQVFGADNSNGQLVIVTVDDAKGWVVTTSSLTQITDEDFLGAAYVTMVDGYHIFVRPTGEQWFISDLLDPLSYDGFDIATAESQPDGLIACVNIYNTLWLFGERTIEVWQDTGNSDFPFERVSGATVSRGCAARGTIAQFDNTLGWLGDDLIVYRNQGYQPVRISTHALENEIRKYEQADGIFDAYAFSFAVNGHTFYVLTFPSSNATWAFDASTGVWTNFQSGVEDMWNVSAYAFVYGESLVGSADGKIYRLDNDVYEDDGEVLFRQAVSPPFQADTKRAKMASIIMDMEVGVGLTTGQGSNPQLVLDWSDDGGFNWSNQQFASIGAIGEYKKRVEFRRLGSFRQRSLRFTVTDPVKVSFYAAAVSIEGLAS
jgi:hypothetical protein